MLSLRAITVSMCVIALAAIISPAVTNCSELVTRNDFIALDTTMVIHFEWNSVAIDESGKIYTVTCQIPYGAYPKQSSELTDRITNSASSDEDVLRRTTAGKSPDMYQHLTVFLDKFGTITGTHEFLPDSTNPPEYWLSLANTEISSNDAGDAFIPYSSTTPAYPGNEGIWDFFLLMGDQCQPKPDPFVVGDIERFPYHYSYLPRGAINNAGTVGAVWGLHGFDLMLREDSMAVRLYDPDSDSLSPFILPSSLPQPLHNDPLWTDWSGETYGGHGHPAMGIADDGSFAVTWMISHAFYPGLRLDHAYYVVYNSDYTKKCDVQLVNCYGDFSDTTQCKGGPIVCLDMAMESDGDFYIVWMGIDGSIPDHYTRYQIWMRGYDSFGNPKYDMVHVNDIDSTNIALRMLTPHIACDDSGNVLISWADGRHYPQFNDHNIFACMRDLFAQKINPDGDLVGPNYKISGNPGQGDARGVDSDCAMNNDGQAVFLWDDGEFEDGSQYFGRRAMMQLMPYHDIGTFAPGDVNLDMQGDIDDVVYLIEYIFGQSGAKFWPRDLADMNGDGFNGDIDDVVFMINYIFAGGPEPKTPYEGIRPPLP